MGLLTPLDPCPNYHVKAYDFSATTAGRTERGLEATVHVINGNVRWADTVVLSNEVARAAALMSITASVSLDGTSIRTALLELMPMVERALRQAVTLKPWPEPSPFKARSLPGFPVASLPPWLRDMTVAVAEAKQVPVDLPAMLSLAVLGTACAKKASVLVDAGWFASLNVYIMVAMEPGERKSPTFRAMLKSLLEFECDLIEEKRAELETAKSAQQVAKLRVDEAQRALKDAVPEDRDALRGALEEANRDLAAASLPVIPQLCADDITTEQVPVILEQNQERLAILSEEGDSLDIMAGKYSSGTPNFGIYLKGWDGGFYKVNRGSRPSIYLKHPLMTIGLCVQPAVLKGLAATPAFRGRGLLGRFWYALPTSRMGTRQSQSQAVDPAVQERYGSCVRRLLELPVLGGDDQSGSPQTLKLQTASRVMHAAFEDEIEPLLSEDGSLHTIADWASKLGGGVARLAGLLHMARYAVGEVRLEDYITQQTMQDAITIGRYLLEHAQATFGLMKADPEVEQARSVIDWLCRKGLSQFSRRDLYRDLPSRFEHPDAAVPTINLLIEHGWIREAPSAPKQGRGRPAGQVYEVYPEIGSQYSQNRQKYDPPEKNTDFGALTKIADNSVSLRHKYPVEPPAWLDDGPLPDSAPTDDEGF